MPAGLFYNGHIFIGDVNLVLPSLNLSSLIACILIMVHLKLSYFLNFFCRNTNSRNGLMQSSKELKKITKVLLNKFTSFSIQVNRLPSNKSSSAAKVSNINDIITLVDLE